MFLHQLHSGGSGFFSAVTTPVESGSIHIRLSFKISCLPYFKTDPSHMDEAPSQPKNKLPLIDTLSLVSVAALLRNISDILEADCMNTSRYNESFIVIC